MGIVIIACGCSDEKTATTDDAIDSLLVAKELIAEGNHEAALEKLNASIEQRPDAWAYFERAQLYAKAGDDEKAKTDIAAGLKLDDKNSKLKWLQKEIKKTKASRFKKTAPVGK